MAFQLLSVVTIKSQSVPHWNQPFSWILILILFNCRSPHFLSFTYSHMILRCPYLTPQPTSFLLHVTVKVYERQCPWRDKGNGRRKKGKIPAEIKARGADISLRKATNSPKHLLITFYLFCNDSDLVCKHLIISV